MRSFEKKKISRLILALVAALMPATLSLAGPATKIDTKSIADATAAAVHKVNSRNAALDAANQAYAEAVAAIQKYNDLRKAFVNADQAAKGELLQGATVFHETHATHADEVPYDEIPVPSIVPAPTPEPEPQPEPAPGPEPTPEEAEAAAMFDSIRASAPTAIFDPPQRAK